MGKIKVDFADRDEAERVLELVRHTNVLAQKPLVSDELRFVAEYPDIAKDLLTFTPLESLA